MVMKAPLKYFNLTQRTHAHLINAQGRVNHNELLERLAHCPQFSQTVTASEGVTFETFRMLSFWVLWG